MTRCASRPQYFSHDHSRTHSQPSTSPDSHFVEQEILRCVNNARNGNRCPLEIQHSYRVLFVSTQVPNKTMVSTLHCILCKSNKRSVINERSAKRRKLQKLSASKQSAKRTPSSLSLPPKSPAHPSPKWRLSFTTPPPPKPSSSSPSPSPSAASRSPGARTSSWRATWE